VELPGPKKRRPSEEEMAALEAQINECIDLCRFERKGIYARDVDLLLNATRRFDKRRELTMSQLNRLEELIPRVLASQPRRMERGLRALH
jgi:hypothetical protein